MVRGWNEKRTMLVVNLDVSLENTLFRVCTTFFVRVCSNTVSSFDVSFRIPAISFAPLGKSFTFFLSLSQTKETKTSRTKISKQQEL